MIDSNSLIKYLSENKARYEKDFNVTRIGIFGSVARGEQKRYGQSKMRHCIYTYNMKRFVILGFMIFLAINNLKAARVITQFDIARWYLDSDLVLIFSTGKIDTVFLGYNDFYTLDSLHLTYDVIREIYQIEIDSVIKPYCNQHVFIDSVCSQDFSINYRWAKHGDDKYIYKLNEPGDTVAGDTVKTLIMYDHYYSDSSYFRLEKNKKHIVILSLTDHGYMIDYATEISDSILKLISEVKDKGQAYFDDFFKTDKK